MNVKALYQIQPSEAHRLRVSIIEALSQLSDKYGELSSPTERDPLDALILGLLGQNNTESHSRQAFLNLKKKYGLWANLLGARTRDISVQISQNGKHLGKASRIKRILRQIEKKRGNLNLGFLKEIKLEEARDFLLSIKEIGQKITSHLLLFSLNRPNFLMNTHLYRISKRLGWLPQGISLEISHIVLKSIIPHYLFTSVYLQFEKHGRMVCKGIKPKCRQCILRSECQFYKKTLKVDLN